MADEKITTGECAEHVKLMARRTALLHYYFSKTLVDALGEEEGLRLINKAVWAYGEHCGRAVREGLEAQGLPNTPENYNKVPDLPGYGWDIDTVTQTDGEERPIARTCPLADTFLELGEEGRRFGRLYCYVDQAKQHGYDPDYEFIHAKNVLDGDPFCEFLVQRRGGPEPAPGLR